VGHKILLSRFLPFFPIIYTAVCVLPKTSGQRTMALCLLLLSKTIIARIDVAVGAGLSHIKTQDLSFHVRLAQYPKGRRNSVGGLLETSEETTHEVGVLCPA
jgi:hypothetical protein